MEAHYTQSESDDSPHLNYECAMCLEVMADPRILPCGHSFCYECLKKQSQTQTQTQIQQDGDVGSGHFSKMLSMSASPTPMALICAMCRRQHKGEAIEHIPKNYALASEIDLLQKAEPRCCHYCTQKADKYCEVCDVFLCTACFPIEHPPTRVLNSHSIIAPSKAKPKCPDHPLESLRFYCQNCVVLVCRDCVVVEHSGHTLTTTEEAASQKRKDFAAISRAPVQIKIQTSEQNLKRYRDRLMDLNTQAKEMESNIQREEEQMKKMLELDHALDMAITQPSDTDLLGQSQAVLDDLQQMCSAHKVQIGASFSSVGSWYGAKADYSPYQYQLRQSPFGDSHFQRKKFYVNGYNK